MSFLFPLGMAALGALLPLIALYLLKQKRVEEKVPANFLWTQAVEDLRASSLFQRFRAPLLFLLQATAIVLAALAAAGASLDLDVGQAPRHVIVVLDRSRSMGAVDGDPDVEDTAEGAGGMRIPPAGSPTRFDEARRIAADLADGLSGTDEMMILAFDSRTEVLASFTADAGRLKELLDGLAPRDAGTDLRPALETAISYARESRGYEPEIVLLTDGALAGDLPSVPCPLRYAKIGRSRANQGIVALQIARTPGEPTQCFVRVENGNDVAVRRTLSLRRGDEVIDARRLELPAEGSAVAWFDVPEPEGTAAVPMTVALEGRDLIAADDVASFLLRPAVPRIGLVVRAEPTVHLVPEKVGALRRGLVLTAVSPGEAEAWLAAQRADLVIYDGVTPATLPDVHAQIYVDAVPPGVGLGDGGVMADPIIIDWNRTHPVTSRCQFDDVYVVEARRLVGAERCVPVIESTGGPIAVLAPAPGGREVLVLAFSPSSGNLWQKLTWPLLLANAFEHLLGGAERPGEESFLPTGKPVDLEGRGPFTITDREERPLPDTPTALEADVTGRTVFPGARRAGIHRFAPPEGPATLHAFVHLDDAEVRCAPREEIVLGGAAARSDPSGLRRNLLLRDPLLLAVLAVLLLEWAVWAGRR